MKTVIIVDDYRANGIWDKVVEAIRFALPNKPKCWRDPKNPQPEGDWNLVNAMWPHLEPDIYDAASIPRPPEEKLPAIFITDENGIIGRYRVNDMDAVKFIREHIS
ncbi:MAG TPA: hypothetical protein VFT82_04215 [Candidatus Paceibacterota bacterium]|nr:hypothetical protein [Candidatus Paceibacterota bacterium]